MNFLGGDIFQYSKIDVLIDYLKDRKLKANFYTHYKNWNEICCRNILVNGNYLHVIVNDFQDIQIDNICTIIKQTSDYLSQVYFRFVIHLDEDLEVVNELLEKYPIEYSLIPFFDGNNMRFFVENVFLNQKDILERKNSKIDIYHRQTFNLHDMGKLIQTSDGLYYSNLNFPSLGNSNDHILDVITRELNSGFAWKRTRDEKPCIDCVFQYLCPSPSNYEIALNKNNLCFIK